MDHIRAILREKKSRVETSFSHNGILWLLSSILWFGGLTEQTAHTKDLVLFEDFIGDSKDQPIKLSNKQASPGLKDATLPTSWPLSQTKKSLNLLQDRSSISFHSRQIREL